MSKEPLTKEEKLELITSGEKFVYNNRVYCFNAYWQLLCVDESGETEVTFGFELSTFYLDEIYKYEPDSKESEPKEEWVDVGSGESEDYFCMDVGRYGASVTQVKKSWIIEKAKEFGYAKLSAPQVKALRDKGLWR